MLHIVLIVIAIVCFVIRAFGVPTGRVDLLPLGLAFLAAAFLV